MTGWEIVLVVVLAILTPVASLGGWLAMLALGMAGHAVGYWPCYLGALAVALVVGAVARD